MCRRSNAARSFLSKFIGRRPQFAPRRMFVLNDSAWNGKPVALKATKPAASALKEVS